MDKKWCNVEEIKVGCYRYRLLYIDHYESDALNVYGRFSHRESKIKIESGLPKDQELEVTIHELLHAVFLSYYGEHEQEEQIVTQLAKGISQVICDNHGLVKRLGDLVG